MDKSTTFIRNSQSDKPLSECHRSATGIDDAMEQDCPVSLNCLKSLCLSIYLSIYLLRYPFFNNNNWGTEAIQALSRLATRLSTRQGRPKSLVSNDIFGRLSLALVRANSRAILSRSL